MRYRLPLSFVAAFILLCGVTFAQPAESKVDAPSIGKRDQPIRINHPAGAKVQAIYVAGGVWSYLAEGHFQRFDTHTVFAAPPGDYLITTGDSRILKVVDGGGPQPNPPPGPGPEPPPGPEPKPEPKLKVKWAVWVYQQEDAAKQIEQTNTRLSIETRNYLTSRKIRMSAYDADQAAAKAFKAVSASLPSVVFVEDSHKYEVREAPATLEELKAMVKEVAGE